jgi:glutamine synthetase
VYDGEKVTTFHPNTIVYSVPSKSPLGNTIRQAKIGIVWHTIYTGTSFETMKASFGKEIASKLRKSKNVWSVDAMFTDVSGSATFTEKETKQITKLLSEAGKLFSKLEAKTLNGISDDALLLQKVKTHFNTKVRDGQKITNVKSHVKGLVNYIVAFYDKEAGKRKSEKGKNKQIEKRDDVLKFFSNANVRHLENIFTMMNLLIDAKEMIIRKMDQASNITTLLRTKDGFQVTAPEGYVAIDTDGSALKLVDRMQFSQANFSSEYIKGWS